MAFQFTCPQGHLLEGDETHAGMQSQCPMCGAAFLIPPPPAAEPGVGVGPAGEAGFPGMQFGPAIGPALEPPEQPAAGPEVGVAPPAVDPQQDPDRIVHILCPNGHELETPMSMVGSDAMCPHCQTAFRLRYEDSKEYREEREKERERRDAAFGRKALNWAIVTAVLIFLGLIVLMALNIGR